MRKTLNKISETLISVNHFISLKKEFQIYFSFQLSTILFKFHS